MRLQATPGGRILVRPVLPHRQREEGMSGFGGSGQTAAARPQVVTIAGWLLVIGGVLGAFGALSLLGLGAMFAAVGGAYPFLFGLVTLALSVAEAWVGLQILKLTANGLKYGTMVSYASIAMSVLMAFAFSYGWGSSSFIGLLIPAFVVWTLNQNKALFTN